MSEPATAPGDSRHSNLVLRVAAAIVLLPVALGATYVGGWPLLALACLTACGLFVEWQLLVGVRRNALLAGGVFLLMMTAAALNLRDLGAAIVCIAAAALFCAAFSQGALRVWSGAGAIYAGAALVAAVVLRQDRSAGFEALLFVFLIVWATDILGYFAGRGIGGPKLWVRISPKKTWSGAIAGLVGSALVAALFAWLDGRTLPPLVVVAIVLSVISQGGDLFESAVKRRFGAKDSSQLIPGHGGLLDRLDGFVAAAVAAALIGELRSGTDAAGQGLLNW